MTYDFLRRLVLEITPVLPSDKVTVCLVVSTTANTTTTRTAATILIITAVLVLSIFAKNFGFDFGLLKPKIITAYNGGFLLMLERFI
jgi:hypothetical protein